jgi:hypothetical protein
MSAPPEEKMPSAANLQGRRETLEGARRVSRYQPTATATGRTTPEKLYHLNVRSERERTHLSGPCVRRDRSEMVAPRMRPDDNRERSLERSSEFRWHRRGPPSARRGRPQQRSRSRDRRSSSRSSSSGRRPSRRSVGARGEAPPQNGQLPRRREQGGPHREGVATSAGMTSRHREGELLRLLLFHARLIRARCPTATKPRYSVQRSHTQGTPPRRC